MANEKRLIDANAIQLEPDPWGGMNGVLMLGRSGGKTMAMVQAALKRMIDNAPTVDAVEVVHGRWVGHYDGSWIHKRKWLTGYDCSVCGNFINTMTPYCPNCGADMRDGDGNE